MEQNLKEHNMKINKPKTEVIVTGTNSPNVDIWSDGAKFKQGNTFLYLGSKITTDGNNSLQKACKVEGLVLKSLSINRRNC